jgi:hypothetical protein
MQEKNPFKFIAYAVCGIHLLFLLVLLCASPHFLQKKKHTPLLIKTFESSSFALLEKKPSPALASTSATLKSSPPTPSPAVVSIPASPKASLPKSAPAKLQNTSAKKTTKQKADLKKETLKTVMSKKSDSVKKSKDPLISNDLLKQLEASIAKMDSTSDKNKKNKTAPMDKADIALSKLQIDTLKSMDCIEDSDYVTLLTQYLHTSLHLPDFGEVKIELTLHQDGTVAKLVVLKAESQKNKKYLESTLTHLQFPFLRGSYAKQQQCTFTLNFCNEL